jgi:hypothetical protein
MNNNHPIQPFITAEHGVTRFKENKIVNFLLDNGGYDLNRLCTMGFPEEDWEQLMMLIGYSFSGFGDLSRVSNKTYARARRKYEAYQNKRLK